MRATPAAPADAEAGQRDGLYRRPAALAPTGPPRPLCTPRWLAIVASVQISSLDEALSGARPAAAAGVPGRVAGSWRWGCMYSVGDGTGGTASGGQAAVKLPCGGQQPTDSRSETRCEEGVCFGGRWWWMLLWLGVWECLGVGESALVSENEETDGRSLQLAKRRLRPQCMKRRVGEGV